MSFILEALTQSEEERLRGEVPSFSSSQSSPVDAPAKPSRWPYVLSVGLLVNLAVLLVWLIARGPEERPAVVARPATTPGSADITHTTDRPAPAEAGERVEPTAEPALTARSTAKAAPTAERTEGSAGSDKPAQAETARATPAAAEVPSAPADGKTDQPPPSSALVAKATRVPESSRAESPSAAPLNRAAGDNLPRTPAERREAPRRAIHASLAALPPPTTNRAVNEMPVKDSTTRPEPVISGLDGPPLVPRIRDLPKAVRASLPNIDFTVHVYAQDPAARVVRLNGTMLREGHAINGELRLVKITPTGVILDASGNRFHMGVRDQWRAQ